MNNEEANLASADIPPKEFFVPPKLQIVVARFMEKVDWCLKEPFEKFEKVIYNKGTELVISPSQQSSSPVQVITLENVGREAHTFLYHIVNNYDTLADLLVFLPGSCCDATKVTITHSVMRKALATKSTVLQGKHYKNIRRDLSNFTGPAVWAGTNNQNKGSLPSVNCSPASIRPFGKWYEHYFGSILTNVVCFTSIFAVSREQILKRPLSHYVALLSCLSSHSNPEEGHFMERSWEAVFGPIPEECLYYANSTQQIVQMPVLSSLVGLTSASDMLSKFMTKKSTGSVSKDKVDNPMQIANTIVKNKSEEQEEVSDHEIVDKSMPPDPTIGSKRKNDLAMVFL